MINITSSRQKGDTAEREVQKILENRGYIVQRAWRKFIKIKGKWISMDNDFFGCFDIMALSNNSSICTKLIQVTAGDDRRVSERRKKIIKIKKYLGLTNPEIWQRIKDNGKVAYRVYIYPDFKKRTSYILTADIRRDKSRLQRMRLLLP